MTADRPAPRARVRRKPHRARYDRHQVYAILDAAPFAHVATVRRDRPVVLPMAYARMGDTLVLHGSPRAGLFGDLCGGGPVCVTATLLDGLVLGRAARYHSMNYRSVTVHGHARPVTAADEITAGLRALVEHLAPGRWEQVRRPAAAELRETALWRVGIDDASVKARGGPPLDPAADRDLPVWAGHLPARLAFDAPVPAADLPPGIAIPANIAALTRQARH